MGEQTETGPDGLRDRLAEALEACRTLIPEAQAAALLPVVTEHMAQVRAAALREAADAINALPPDFECDPGRGDAANLLRRMADDEETSR